IFRFFFSSRRRHTRFSRDWSSDVCSSDLLLHRGVCARHLLYAGFLAMAATTFVAFSPLAAELPVARYLAVVLFSAIGGLIPATRSEERRVGKESKAQRCR